MRMWKIEDRVGFIGGGNIAFAMGSVLIAKGNLKPSQVYVSGPHQENLEKWRKIGVHTTKHNGVVQIEAEIGKSVCDSYKLFISVVTGVTVDQLELAFSFMKVLKMIRAMPNISVQSGEGITIYVPGRRITTPDLEKLRLILSSLGLAEQVPEMMMDSISALTASGPAYVFTVIKAMRDGGVQQGIPLEIALRFAAQTALGAAKFVLRTGKHPAILRDEECSLNGSTMVGLHELEKVGIRNGFINAIETVTNMNLMQGLRGLTEEFDCPSIKLDKAKHVKTKVDSMKK